jgi:hypothetical protein
MTPPTPPTIPPTIGPVCDCEWAAGVVVAEGTEEWVDVERAPVLEAVDVLTL